MINFLIVFILHLDKYLNVIIWGHLSQLLIRKPWRSDQNLQGLYVKGGFWISG